VNLAGIWQAAYTAGVVLPKPVATATYWHRALQPRKLIAVNFTRLAARPDAQAALWLRPDKSALGKGRLLRTCQQLGVAALGHMRSLGRYSMRGRYSAAADAAWRCLPGLRRACACLVCASTAPRAGQRVMGRALPRSRG